jgi:radical SAM superfamily enzyme YgiQ (UPF0313 family)
MHNAQARSQKKPLALLIFPPVYEFALYDLYIKPYALLRIGKWLVESGFDVKVLNCLDYQEPRTLELLGAVKRQPDGTGKFFRSRAPKPAVLQNVPRHFFRYGILKEVIEKELQLAKPEIILISSGLTYWYWGVQEVVEACRKLLPRVPVVVGGPYATLCEEHCRQVLGPDYVVKGEALPGLIPVLQKLSLPYGKETLTEEFLVLPEILREAAVVRLNSGCPYRCDYCASHQLIGPYKQGCPERLFKQVEVLVTRYGIRQISFLDDALLFRKEKALIPFLNAIIESGLPVNFYTPNAMHLDLLDEELARLMKRAGFRTIFIGFESANPAFHETLDQKLDIGNLKQGVKYLKKAGFRDRDITVYILGGLPGQGYQEVEDSIRYAATFEINMVLAEFSPVPGTPLWNRSVEQSSYPLTTEPLTQNNSIFPLEWSGFPLEQLIRLKRLTKELAPAKSGTPQTQASPRQQTSG